MSAVSPNLVPASAPTIYFIGVSTGNSSILRIFPAWAKELGLRDARIVGIDLPLHAPAAAYRRVVEFLKADKLSLGALVTTHKIDLYAACHDLFDTVDDLAAEMGELSCISKRNGRLIASAKDPISAGLALETYLPPQHFARTGAELFCMGAGGSTIAISWYLTRPERGADRPSRVVISNRSQPRLDSIKRIHETLGLDVPVEYVLTPTHSGNNAVMAGLLPGSLVVNATGLGKDAPGSPISDETDFPQNGLAWELNYRGDLVFLRQARAAAARRRLIVEDGWAYFLHGWTQVIAEVFNVAIPTSGPLFQRLSELAGGPPALERAS